MHKRLDQELALCESIRRDLRKKRFGLIPECCKVFHQRAYFSRDRNATIIVDISIEVSTPGADTPFFIWVWESKNYSSALSVDHVEEFHAKLQQIGADKTKGTIVVRGEIQKAALAYAASNGIGVAKFLPHDRVHFVSFCRPDPTPEQERAELERETLAAMTDPQFECYNRGFFAYSPDGRPFHGEFEQLLQDGFRDILPFPVWRTDLQGWHWRMHYEA